jgi:hypothetical protein
VEWAAAAVLAAAVLAAAVLAAVQVQPCHR